MMMLVMPVFSIALTPILVTLFGIVMLVRLEQPKRMKFSILVMLLGIFMLVRLEQLVKAPSSMLVTLEGMVTLVRLEQLAKALSPMLVTLEGMVKEFAILPAGYRIKYVLFLLYKTPFSEE
jgi:hypothetical protein